MARVRYSLGTSNNHGYAMGWLVKVQEHHDCNSPALTNGGQHLCGAKKVGKHDLNHPKGKRVVFTFGGKSRIVHATQRRDQNPFCS